MNIKGRSRASTYVHMEPEPKSRIIEVLRPNDPVDVQGEAGEMFEVESKRLLPPVGGYVPKSSIARRIPVVEVFPKIKMNDGASLGTVGCRVLPAFERLLWVGFRGSGKPREVRMARGFAYLSKIFMGRNPEEFQKDVPSGEKNLN